MTDPIRIKPNNTSATVPEKNVKPIANKFVELLKLICKKIISILRRIGFLSTPYKATDEQKKAVDLIRNYPHVLPTRAPQKPVTKLNIATPKNEEVVFDNMHIAMHDMANLALDATVEELSQEGQTKRAISWCESTIRMVPSYLKPFNEWIIRFGKNSATELNVIDESSKKFFDFLIEEQDKDVLERACKKFLKPHTPILAKTKYDLHHYYSIVINKILKDVEPDFNDPDLEKEVYDLLQVKLTAFLLEKKLEVLAKKFPERLEGFKDAAIEQAIRPNLQKLTEKVANRVEELVGKVEFPNLFDKCIETFYMQVEMLDHAAKEKAKVKEEIEIAKRAKNCTPYTEEEKEIQKKYIEDLEFIESQGGEKKFIETRYWQDIVSHPSCHPSIKAQIRNNIKTTDADAEPKESNTILEEEEWRNVVTQVIKLIFPDDVRKIDLKTVWNNCEINDEINKLFDDAKKLVKKIISEEKQKKIEDGVDKWLPQLDKVLTRNVEKKVIPFIVQAIQNGVESVINPKRLKLMIADNIFPSMNSTLLSSFIDRRVANTSTHLNKMAKLFHRLITNEEPAIIAKNLKHISRKLYDYCKDDMGEFDIFHDGVSKAEFEELTSQVINPIYEMLKGCCSNEVTVEEVHTLIKRYYKPSFTVTEHQTIDNLVEKLVFDLGEFSNPTLHTLYNQFIKESIGGMLATSVQAKRRGFHAILNSGVSNIRGQYKTKEKVKNLIFGEGGSIDEAEKKLKKQVSKFAGLFYDTVMAELPLPAKLIAKTPLVLGTDRKTIKQVINNIVNNLFFDRTLNLNLILNLAKNSIDQFNLAARDIASVATSEVA